MYDEDSRPTGVNDLIRRMRSACATVTGFLERNVFLIENYIVIFAFSGISLNSIYSENNFIVKDPQNFIQLDISAVVHCFLCWQSLPDIGLLGILCFYLNILFNEPGLSETDGDGRLADPLLTHRQKWYNNETGIIARWHSYKIGLYVDIFSNLQLKTVK
ncbi:hypothetical protein RF11_13385 [Thelohanellus kitauei]|uniref:Uncharacterized protein n=1 Tax=Thelohanellus kitauei TaxID=669202 RepID=A0A0C2I500_THEKT|nr:hypothetical protein RF11_13385 [Thelohanellus kitauei]